MSRANPSPLYRAGFAILTAALAAGLTWLFPLLGSRIPFALFYAAVMLSAWYGGIGAGLLATTLSALLSAYLFLSHDYSLDIGLEGVLLLVVFLGVSLVIVWLTEKVRLAGLKARASQEQLSTTLRSIGDAVIATDAQGRVTFLNEVAQVLTGWSPEEAVGKELREVFRIIDEETREEVENPVTKVIREGAVVSLSSSTVLMAKDGRETPIDDSGAPIRDALGNIAGVVLVFRNIAEQRHAEELRYRLASIVESSEDAIIGKTLDGIITNWNAGAERLYGYSAQEIVGRPISTLVPEDRPNELPKIFERLRRGERIEYLETKRVVKDGRVIDIALTISPIKNAHGAIIGASTIARDITERKRTEAALRASEERYRAFVANSSEAIWRFELAAPVPLSLPVEEQIELCYEHGYLGECNDAMARMYGFNRAAEIVGARLGELLVRDDPNNLEFMRSFISSGYRLANAESHEIDREGRARYFMNNLVGIVEGGQLVRAWGTQIDITERKRAEKERAELFEREQAARIEAEEANRMKDEFLATLSHELRTPLTAMLGWTRLLLTKELDEATATRALETVERNAKAQAQLIEDLLDASRIITGNQRLDVRPVELVPVIEAATDSVRPAANAKSINLQTTLDPLLGPISGDPQRLQQVVWNLLSNAVKFTPAGGQIVVRLERRGADVLITVSDTGQGISREFLPFIFDRFRQADSSTTRAHGGLGLGLAIVRHLVELHGGTVHAESEGEGRGATFQVRLSAPDSRAADVGARHEPPLDPPSATPELPPGLLNGLRLLIVEDDEDARELMKIVLERQGASVVAARNVPEALEAFERERPDVLISDIGMPDQNGYDLIRMVRARGESDGGQLPAAAVSAYADEENRRQSLAAGFQFHLAKPLDTTELIEVVLRLAQKPQPD